MNTSLITVAFTAGVRVFNSTLVQLRETSVSTVDRVSQGFHGAVLTPEQSAMEALSVVKNAIDSVSVGDGVSGLRVARDHCSHAATDGLLAIEHVAAWLDAQRHKLVVASVGESPVALAKRIVDEDVHISDIRVIELAAILNVTPHYLRNMAANSRTLIGSLDKTMHDLERGTLSGYRASLIIDGFRALAQRFSNAGREFERSTQERYETRVLWRAGTKTTSELRRTIKLTVALLAPPVDEGTHESARSERTVMVTPASDGMSWLTAYLTNADASRVFQALTHVARVDNSLTGSQSNRMADALVQIMDGTCEVTAESRNAAAELQVLVSLDQMISTAKGTGNTQLVGEIASTGMVLEGQALLDLLGDSKFRRILFQPETGELLDVGRESYRPPRRIRQHVEVRDRTCRAPGCVRPARYSDIDHITPWDDGGTTAIDNLAALCRTHHVLKTHGEWQYEISDKGAVWKIPGGYELTREKSDFRDLVSTV